MMQTKCGPIDWGLAAQVLDNRALQAPLVLGVEKTEKGVHGRCKRIVAVTDHFLPARRLDDFTAVEIPIPDAVTAAVHGQLVTLLRDVKLLGACGDALFQLFHDARLFAQCAAERIG